MGFALFLAQGICPPPWPSMEAPVLSFVPVVVRLFLPRASGRRGVYGVVGRIPECVGVRAGGGGRCRVSNCRKYVGSLQVDVDCIYDTPKHQNMHRPRGPMARRLTTILLIKRLQVRSLPRSVGFCFWFVLPWSGFGVAFIAAG